MSVNGKAMRLDEPLTVQQLIAKLGLGEGPVAVERNREIVPRAAHASTPLADGDQIEIVHFVGGG